MDDSVFSTRLGTNYTATEQEIIQLNALLVEPRAKLAQLQKDIECARLIHIDLCNQHDALSRQIEAHRALMAPIRRLPVDVIRDIFLQCLPTEHNSLMSKHTAPILLTQVCSGWRNIAHSTPSLWSSIHIVFARNINRNRETLHPSQVPVPVVYSALLLIGQNQAQGVKEWLSRSGACWLDISIYDISNTDADVDTTCHEIIDSLIAVSTRWGNVDLDIPARFLERFAALLVSDVLMLHALSIPDDFNSNVMGPPGGTPQWGSMSLWKDSGMLKAPRLRQISYKKQDGIADSSECFAAFPLKWPQLTTILFVVSSGWDPEPPETTFSNILTILRSCTALVKCTVEMHVESGQAASSEQAINMAAVSLLYLEQLYVNLGVESLRSLFRVLEAPALQHLEVFTDIKHLSDSCTAQLMLFLTQSGTGANLRRITVNPLNFTKANFIQLMEACPNLNSLCLKNFRGETNCWGCGGSLGFNSNGFGHESSPLYGVDDDFLRSLCAVAEGPLYKEDQIHGGALLQKLTTFECLIGENISDDAILDFVTAKRSIGVLAPLRRITMALDRQQTMISMVDKLRPFVADGLKCKISYVKPIPPSAPLAYEGIPSLYTNQRVVEKRVFLDF